MADEERSPAVQYLTRFYEQKAAVRERWKEDAGSLLDAHQLIFSAIISVIDRHAGEKFDEQEKGIEGRLSLTAQFIQSVDICEVAISEGLYLQAAALLKQEFEAIEAMHEFAGGKRREGKTPQLDYLKDFGRAYGMFNDYAHLGKEDLHKWVVEEEKPDGDLHGPSIVPQYNKELAATFYGLHVFLIFCCAQEVFKLHQTLYDAEIEKEELAMLHGTLEILQEWDIIKPKPKE